jgi:hypothetical protein
MHTFSKELQNQIGDFLAGEEHSDYVFECLQSGKHDFVLTFLRGSAPAATWAAVYQHLANCQDACQLFEGADRLRKYAQRQTIRETLIKRCEEEIRKQQIA